MVDDVLQQAVQLAKNGKTSEAIQFLKNYVRQHPKDARAWWLIANLISDPKVKQESLKRVLILKPDHSKAKAMLAKFEAKTTPVKPNDGADWLTAELPTEDDSFPTMEAFGFSASPAPPTSTTKKQVKVDEKVLFDNLQRKKLERQRAESGKKEIDSRTWMYIIGGILTITAILVAILIVAYIRSTRGPALNATARNNYVSVDYPDEWGAVRSGDYTLVVSTSEIDVSDINPWAAMHDADLRAYPSFLESELKYWYSYYSFNLNFDPTDLFTGGSGFEELDPESLLVVVVQALPGHEGRGYDAQAIVDRVGNDLKGNSFETDFYTFEHDVDVKKSDIEISGQQGIFTRITVTSEFDFFGSSETISSFYFATVRNGDIEYLFLFSASEEKAGKWEKTAKRMAESMELFAPAESPSS